MVVHIIVFPEGAAGIAQATAQIQALGNGWIEIRPCVWMVGGDLNVQEWRDALAADGADVFVARLAGAWGTHGMQNVAGWMQGARGAF
jgi:hypothetical protein